MKDARFLSGEALHLLHSGMIRYCEYGIDETAELSQMIYWWFCPLACGQQAAMQCFTQLEYSIINTYFAKSISWLATLDSVLQAYGTL